MQCTALSPGSGFVADLGDGMLNAATVVVPSRRRRERLGSSIRYMRPMPRSPTYTQLSERLHGAGREVFGDQACWKEDGRQFLESWVIRYRINRPPHRPAAAERALVHDQSGAFAHPRLRRARLSRVKQLWGFSKVRYRGLTKNLARARRPCSPWLISTECGISCSRPGRDACCEPDSPNYGDS
jgi:hypothetical protein